MAKGRFLGVKIIDLMQLQRILSISLANFSKNQLMVELMNSCFIHF